MKSDGHSHPAKLGIGPGNRRGASNEKDHLIRARQFLTFIIQIDRKSSGLIVSEIIERRGTKLGTDGVEDLRLHDLAIGILQGDESYWQEGKQHQHGESGEPDSDDHLNK